MDWDKEQVSVVVREARVVRGRSRTLHVTALGVASPVGAGRRQILELEFGGNA